MDDVIDDTRCLKAQHNLMLKAKLSNALAKGNNGDYVPCINEVFDEIADPFCGLETAL